MISSIFGSFAEGGRVTGPGTDKSDGVLARLSAGEYVINAKAVKFWGPDLFDRLNQLARIDPRRLLPGYASGGPVGPTVMSQARTLTNNIANIDRLTERVRDPEGVRVDVGVRAEVDKERLVKFVTEDPRFSKAVQKSNNREARSLSRILGGG
jgi:hypothetical protein